MRWGKIFDCVVDDKSFVEISVEKRMLLVSALVKSAYIEPEITPEEQHNEWLKTCPKDHPCNKPYSELPKEVRAKDVIFGCYAIMLKRLEILFEERKNDK